ALPFLAASVLPAAPDPGRAAGPSGPAEKQRLAAFHDEDRKWLDFVAPIVLPEEKKLFLDLTQTWERERFRKEFWGRRERDNLPPPLGPGYEMRYSELRSLAESRYDHWPNDAAAIVIRFGEPSSIDTLEFCNEMGPGAMFRGLEVWTYSNTRAL